MLRRAVTITLATLLGACGSKTPPPPAPDTAAPATTAPAAPVPDASAGAPGSEDVATSPDPSDTHAQVDAPAAPDTAAPEATGLERVTAPIVIAPPGTSPAAVALDEQGPRAALAVTHPSRPGHSAVRVLELSSTPPGSKSLLATVPETLLPAGLGLEVIQIDFDHAGETLAVLGKVMEADKATSRWHTHVWRLSELEGADDAPPTPAWVDVFARTFESKQTPILALREDGARLYLGGYGATAWDIPALPLEGPIPAEPRAALTMPTESGWWLPTEVGSDDPAAFRIIELSSEGQKTYGLLIGTFSAEGLKAELDVARARPLPLFSNGSVRLSYDMFAAEPLDAALPPLVFGQNTDEAEPYPQRLSGDTTLIATGPSGLLLVADGSPRALYALPPHGPELRLPEALAASTIGAIGASFILVAAPDGAVHLLPRPDEAPELVWREANELSTLPAAFRPLFSKEGFAVEGTSAQTSYDEEDSGKVTRSRFKGRCAADKAEVADGVYHASVSCSGLDADYLVDFTGHWYAEGDRLWYRSEAASDLVALRRSPPDFGPGGGCLSQPSGEAHPELSERCLDARGPSRTRFEGGPAAYQVVVELRRAK